MTMTIGAILHPMLVAPLAVLTMLVIAIHASWLSRSAMPVSRRRIRGANAALMMVLCPILAYAVAGVNEQDHRAFVMAWTVTAELLLMIVLVSLADVANTWRLYRREIRTRRARLVERIALDVARRV